MQSLKSLYSRTTSSLSRKRDLLGYRLSYWFQHYEPPKLPRWISRRLPSLVDFPINTKFHFFLVFGYLFTMIFIFVSNLYLLSGLNTILPFILTGLLVPQVSTMLGGLLPTSYRTKEHIYINLPPSNISLVFDTLIRFSAYPTWRRTLKKVEIVSQDNLVSMCDNSYDPSPTVNAKLNEMKHATNANHRVLAKYHEVMGTVGTGMFKTLSRDVKDAQFYLFQSVDNMKNFSNANSNEAVQHMIVKSSTTPFFLSFEYSYGNGTRGTLSFRIRNMEGATGPNAPTPVTQIRSSVARGQILVEIIETMNMEGVESNPDRLKFLFGVNRTNYLVSWLQDIKKECERIRR